MKTTRKTPTEAALTAAGWRFYPCGPNSVTPGKWRAVAPHSAKLIVGERFDTKANAVAYIRALAPAQFKPN